MSEIQTEVDRISGEVTSQAGLISQIQTALEGKAAGSGSAVETCTVVLVNGDDQADYYGHVATTFVDGAIVSNQVLNGGYQTFPNMTIENVVCGTSLVIEATGWNSTDWTVDGDATYEGKTSSTYRTHVFNIGTTAGGIVTITLYGND